VVLVVLAVVAIQTALLVGLVLLDKVMLVAMVTGLRQTRAVVVVAQLRRAQLQFPAQYQVLEEMVPHLFTPQVSQLLMLAVGREAQLLVELLQPQVLEVVVLAV